MKNLTEKQQLIIADIMNEFIKTNEDKKVIKKGALLRIDELVEQRDIDIDNKYELELYNKSMFNDFISFVDDTIDTLNNELIDYGLKAFRFQNKNVEQDLHYIHFYIDLIDNANNTIKGKGDQNNFSRNFISIKARNYILSVPFKSGIPSISRYKQFAGFSIQNYYGTGEREYATIEDFAFNSDLRNRINNFVKNK